MDYLDKFMKIYLPVLVSILYFSGFYYVVKYFSYFGLIGVYKEFSAIQYGFFSFHDLISFRFPDYSWKFVGLIFLIILVVQYPDRYFKFPRFIINMFKKLNISIQFINFPVLLRLGVAIPFTFYTMFYLSAVIGERHACQRLLIHNLETGDSDWLFNFPAISEEQLTVKTRQGLKEAFDKSQLVEVWNDDDYVYVGKRISECSNERTTFVLSKKIFPSYSFKTNR